MVDRLKGKVAIVTGAGSSAPGIGNGKAAAILFAREGAKVLCVDNVAERAEEAAAEIVAEGNVASAFQADVSKQADCKRMVATVLERYGGLHILHNNVGISGAMQVLPDITEEAWDNIMQVNVRSVIMSVQASVEAMVASGGGSIINVSALAAFRAYPAPSTAYATSKAAVVGLTHMLAGQLGERGIRVNSVAPGQVYTPVVMAMGMTEERRQQRANSGMIKEEGTGWDTGWASVFFASDESRWITGQTLLVDAGVSMMLVR